MTRRRANSEGSLYRDKQGRWCASVSVKQPDGTSKRKVARCKTKAEATQCLARLRAEQQAGTLITDRTSLADFLQRWLEEKVRIKNRPRTYESYKQMCRLHIVPIIGTAQLAKLTAADVDHVLYVAQEHGCSPRTRAYLRAILRIALGQALKWGLVSRNVATLTDAPPSAPREMAALTLEQAQTLLSAACGDRLEALYWLALMLGLRQGELLGLRWQAVDLDRQTLRVEVALQAINGTLVLGPPKTEKSKRVLPMPPVLVTMLRGQRARQNEERLRLGPDWQDTAGLVFTTDSGRPVIPRNLVTAFKRLLTRAGLPDVRFHDLRHACNSILAAYGVPDRVRMEILGHTNIRTTQEIYTHVYDPALREAADVMERLFG